VIDPEKREEFSLEDPMNIQADQQIPVGMQLHTMVKEEWDKRLVISFDTVERYNNLSHLFLEGEYIVQVTYSSEITRAKSSRFYLSLSKDEKENSVRLWNDYYFTVCLLQDDEADMMLGKL